MPWVRIDDRFAQHPKIMAVGPVAMAMQVAALGYCNRELTDGFVPRSVARTLIDCDPESGVSVSAQWVIERLVNAGIWGVVEGGYYIHDYHEYQPSKEQVLKERGQTLKRVNAYRDRNGSSNAVTNGDSNAGVTPAPVPVSRTRIPVTQSPEPNGHRADALVPADESEAKTKAKPRRRMPANWTPSDSAREYACDWGIGAADLDAFVEEFKRFWIADGRPKADWDLTFMGRVRDVAHKYRGRAPVTQEPVVDTPEQREARERIWREQRAKDTETPEERWKRLHPDLAGVVPIPKS